MRSFYVRKLCAQLFCACTLGLNFTGISLPAQKLHIERWWNWVLVEYLEAAHELYLHSYVIIDIAMHNFFHKKVKRFWQKHKLNLDLTPFMMSREQKLALVILYLCVKDICTKTFTHKANVQKGHWGWLSRRSTELTEIANVKDYPKLKGWQNKWKKDWIIWIHGPRNLKLKEKKYPNSKS
jgi:hypothetical protein